MDGVSGNHSGELGFKHISSTPQISTGPGLTHALGTVVTGPRDQDAIGSSREMFGFF